LDQQRVSALHAATAPRIALRGEGGVLDLRQPFLQILQAVRDVRPGTRGVGPPGPSAVATSSRSARNVARTVPPQKFDLDNPANLWYKVRRSKCDDYAQM
jgi:hypothetical protein